MCGNEPGSKETYQAQVALPLNGRVRNIDHCIHRLVSALNAGGCETVACCCGHGKMPGRIDLEDGRVLVIMTPAQADEAVRRLMDPEWAKLIEPDRGTPDQSILLTPEIT
jgi:hypothetical protein